MSDFIVNGPDVFTRLRETMLNFYQQTPDLLEQIHQSIEGVIVDLNKDQLETEGSLMEKSKEFEALKSKGSNQQDSKSNENHSEHIKEKQEKQHEIHRLNTYKQELVNAQANIKGLGQRVKQLQGELNNHANDAKKGINALLQFEQIALEYLQIGTNNLRNQHGVSPTSNALRNATNSEITGNTLHVKKLDNINQMVINQLTDDAKKYNLSNNNEVKKVSISKVSQLDFAVLTQNGFKIQEHAPNEYSAYKDL